jgi:hypothetical protein
MVGLVDLPVPETRRYALQIASLFSFRKLLTFIRAIIGMRVSAGITLMG